MSNHEMAHLRLLFLAGLAVAGSSCAASPAPPLKPTPTTGREDPPTKGPPPMEPIAASVSPEVAEAKAQAEEFHAIGEYEKAYPDIEHIGFVDTNGMVNPFTCDPAPCNKEWSALAKKAGGSGAVIRRKGVVEYVPIAGFKDKVGLVDTPEKAALRAKWYGRYTLGTCANFAALGLACAKGSAPSGVAVRKVEDGFEVAVYEGRNVCPGPSFGPQVVTLGVTKITTNGDVKPSWESKVGELASREALKASPGHDCKYGSLGRMFAGFVDLPTPQSELEYYVRAQRQEAAAVVAFERLAIELEAHGAPGHLIEAARRSADDERRHTALFQREADRLFGELGIGSELPEPNTPEAFAVRTLPEILRENILEGCVNETYAAVVATYQAERAPTARLRNVFASIADDERGHAALAFRIHAWGLTAVDESTARALRTEQRTAVDRLRSGIVFTSLGRTMGEPEPAIALLAFEHVVPRLVSQEGLSS